MVLKSLLFTLALEGFSLFTPSVAADTSNLTVAMVRIPPPNWPLPLLNKDWTGIKLNISETVDHGISLMKEAAAEGANMVLFPELWFPGFPKGAQGNATWAKLHAADYVENSLTVGDENWNRLIAGIKESGVYAGLAFSEKDDHFIYMAQALITPTGNSLIHRHKLRPSGGERDIFTDGDISGLKVVDSQYGRIGMLECGEHVYPSMTFPMQAQKENLHIASFPYLTDLGDTDSAWWENIFANTGTLGQYAGLSGAYVFTPAVGASLVVDPLMQVVTQIDASVPFDHVSMLYHSMNTTAFKGSKSYDPNGQVSWDILQQLIVSFPRYIPKIHGNFSKQHTVPL